jgi:hypothetical protein
VLVFTIFFIIERIFGLFSRFISLFCCCVRIQEKQENVSAFSTNFLNELSVNDLLHEYTATKNKIEEYAVHMHNELEAAIKAKADQAKVEQAKPSDAVNGPAAEEETRHSEHLHRYFLQRLKLKKKHIKKQLSSIMKTHNVEGWAIQTEENFAKAK